MKVPSRTDRIILFLKAFRAGRVKTRLASRLGDRGALEVYTAMVADLLAKLQPLRDIVVPYFDAVSKSGDSPSSVASLLSQGWLKIQRGGDLGERMVNALQDVFSEGAERAVLIGSDIPEIDSDLLERYLDILREYPMAIGPAADGGYYLIGFQRKHVHPLLFDGIEWSTEQVFEQTLQRARSLELPCFIGEELRDVDTIEDLESLLSSGVSAPSLIELLKGYLVGI
ncbi:MAG: TIGR04282 family arsenosugar biosynthesis glycosyltransferase [Spirochaetaceae bacterium]|nr:MAG: TIGR04282 family arsenosugar biosynthesis glycosyltransferase [Spirochaetaceae bacterium]